MGKDRQQRANVKARKAKAKAAHEAAFDSYKRKMKVRREAERGRYALPSPFAGAPLSMAAMERILSDWDRESRLPRTFVLRNRP